MRLDKFLKLSRIFKRRVVAKEVASLNKIYLNNHLAKPSTKVKIGDIIKIEFKTKTLSIKVLSILNQNNLPSDQFYQLLSESTNLS